VTRVGFALVLVAACGASQRAPAPSTPHSVLILRCPITSAFLLVDDQPVGELRGLPHGVRLAAGRHRVEVRHDGYHTRYVEVTLAPGETCMMDLSLAEAFP